MQILEYCWLLTEYAQKIEGKFSNPQHFLAASLLLLSRYEPFDVSDLYIG